MGKRLAIGLLPLAILAAAALPLLIDQPFVAQTPATLAAVYLLRRTVPALSVVGALALVVLTARVWRVSPRPLARAGLVIALAVSAGGVWVAVQNPFEWKFNPLPGPRYAPIRDAAFVDPSDLVLALTVNGDAAAFPIRQMAYHHLVNDTVGGVPAVVTY